LWLCWPGAWCLQYLSSQICWKGHLSCWGSRMYLLLATTSGWQAKLRTGHITRIQGGLTSIIYFNYSTNYHLAVLIGFPLLFLTLVHRPGMSLIRSRISFIVILSYSSWIATMTSSLEWNSLRRNLCFMIFQQASIGFRSGLCAGRIRFLMLCFFL
jgi:hypothetical protein